MPSYYSSISKTMTATTKYCGEPKVV